MSEWNLSEINNKSQNVTRMTSLTVSDFTHHFDVSIVDF